jgi:hypothetical protein
MNSLMVIVPYKYEGLWVFDEVAVVVLNNDHSVERVIPFEQAGQL